MATPSHYRTIIRRILTEYAQRGAPKATINTEIIADEVNDNYLLLEVGWNKRDRVYMTIMHLDIIDGKIWIQDDGTEDGVGNLLVEAGVPKEHIVLAFYPESHRVHTEFAAN